MEVGSYAKVAVRNKSLLMAIEEVKKDHPFWGYRRIWSYLTYRKSIKVSKNRIYRLMTKHSLLVKKNQKLLAKRTNTTKKPIAAKPNQWWGIDMTKVQIQGHGWMYVTIVLDWYSKKIVGFHAGHQSKARHWIKALNQAVDTQFPHGSRNNNLHLMSDNGCQPTSLSFMKSCSLLEVTQAFTSYNNSKGNTDTERFMRTMKEEIVWPREWRSPMAFKQKLEVWIKWYNHVYAHSSLNYKSPMEYEQESLEWVA